VIVGSTVGSNGEQCTVVLATSVMMFSNQSKGSSLQFFYLELHFTVLRSALHHPCSSSHLDHKHLR
jgi:hypothetical protein